MKKVLAIVLALAMLLSFAAFAESDSASAYAKGRACLTAQQFDAASAYFRSAGSYGDSADYIDYIKVINLGMSGLYAPAASTIANLYSGLADADKYQVYFSVLAAIEDGELKAAESMLADLGDFFNSSELLASITAKYSEAEYDKAEAYLKAGKWDKALEIYEANGDKEMIKETYYRKAVSLLESGDYAGAVSVFSSIIGYKDSVAQLTRVQEIQGITSEFSVGKTVTFGSYIKSADKDAQNEPLEWIVLAVEDGKALLITKNIIDSQIYAKAGEPKSEENEDDDGGEEYNHDEEIELYEFGEEEEGEETGEGGEETPSMASTYGSFVTWYSSSLRKWLNTTFYTKAFNASEKSLIVSTNVKAEVNPVYRVEAGLDTVDNVYILSISELNNYFKNNAARMAKVTPYASKIRGAGSNDAGYGWYWVRNAGKDYFYTATCLRDGSIGTTGYPCNTSYIGIRPVIWVALY